jgi:ATP-dependent exoDNAse (exonuclease V) beta subunit
MFLEWWELNKQNKSVQISGGVDAIQILTVHKSKGLQFKVVLIPFCSWNLDHEGFLAPTLWVKSDTPPFNEAGYLPVKYSSILEQTCFDPYYQEEKLRVYLDNLNLLYVALTRAEHGLIVLAPNPEVRGFKQFVSRVLFEGIVRGEGLGSGWDNVAQVWSAGDWNITGPGKGDGDRSIVTMQAYATSNWRDKLVIKRSAKEFFNDLKTDARTRINYGIHIHSILSAITYESDADKVLDRMVAEGMITSDERPVLKSLLDELLTDEQVRSWFSPEWEVRTEVPVLLPGGGESRMDRLLLRDKHALVIDFKTGEPSAGDQRQMQEYMSILSQMNFHLVEGFLLYIKSGEIVAVRSGKPRKIRKKDEQQLELGL